MLCTDLLTPANNEGADFPGFFTKTLEMDGIPSGQNQSAQFFDQT